MRPFESLRVIGTHALRFAAAVAVLGTGWFAASSFAGNPGYRLLIDEYFDDDQLGASPEGVASNGQDVILTTSGSVFGVKSGDSTAITVVREFSNPDGNCLGLTDNGGDGFARVSFFPSFTTSGAHSEISFDLRRTMNVGDTSFVFSIIDNRTTPGTGRLCTLSLFDDAPLALNSKSTGFRIQPDVDYRIEITLDLSAGPNDTWSFRITNLADPSNHYEAKALRTAIDGSELSLMSATVDSGDGVVSVAIDNFLALAK